MMNEWLKILLSLSISGALLLLLILGLKRFYQNKFSRQWQYYILLLVALRFLLPVAPGAVNAGIVGNLFHKVEQSRRAEGIVTDITAPENTIGVPAAEPDPIVFIPADTDSNKETGIPSAGEKISPAEIKPFYLSACLFSVWAAVALMLFIRKITVYQDYVRFIRAGNREISDRRILNLLSDCRERLRTKASVCCIIKMRKLQSKNANVASSF